MVGQERAREREDRFEIDAAQLRRVLGVALQLTVEHGLEERTQQQRVVGGDEVQRAAHHDDADQLRDRRSNCESDSGSNVDEARPEPDVRVRRDLGLETDEVRDRLERRCRAALEQVLARERRPVQRAFGQQVATAHACIVPRCARERHGYRSAVERMVR